MKARPAVALATVLLATGRLVARAVPTRLLRGVEDRVFHAVFHMTRVTNDAYGWRPEPVEEEGEGALR